MWIKLYPPEQDTFKNTQVGKDDIGGGAMCSSHMCSWNGEGENMWNWSSVSYSLNVQLTHNLDILPSTQENDNHEHSSFIHNIQTESESHR